MALGCLVSSLTVSEAREMATGDAKLIILTLSNVIARPESCPMRAMQKTQSEDQRLHSSTVVLIVKT